MHRRQATEQEAKALANPLRLRILRLCGDGPLTNEQLARRLRRDPGTILHHVRLLVATGFLEAAEPRDGARGSVERPYRSTGKSWAIDVGTADATGIIPMLDAFREELYEAPPEALISGSRAATWLTPQSARELSRRLKEIVDEFGNRREEGGEPYAMFVVAHRRAPQTDEE